MEENIQNELEQLRKENEALKSKANKSTERAKRKQEQGNRHESIDLGSLNGPRSGADLDGQE